MSSDSSSGIQLQPRTLQSLMKELKAIHKSVGTAMEGIRVFVMDDNFACIWADIDGPVGTPFEGGVFRCKLVLSADYPNAPPKGFFITKIFHPNVSASGEICVNTLKKDWKPTHGIQHVLMVIRCLLIEPNPASALNEEAGKLLLEAYGDYAKRAALMTRIHAKPRNDHSAPNANANATAPIATTTNTNTNSSSTTTSSTSSTNTNTNTSTEKSEKNEQNASTATAAAAAAAAAGSSASNMQKNSGEKENEKKEGDVLPVAGKEQKQPLVPIAASAATAGSSKANTTAGTTSTAKKTTAAAAGKPTAGSKAAPKPVVKNKALKRL